MIQRGYMVMLRSYNAQPAIVFLYVYNLKLPLLLMLCIVVATYLFYNKLLQAMV